MLVVLARGRDGEGREGEGRGGCKITNLSMNHHMGRGGVLDIDLLIFSPEQALKPIPLLRKANSKLSLPGYLS